eukprot:c18355_g1_i1.p2 GENE.c18355_g1_i1~~c18355_g1_i1.p2  ORF type:complete len:112 (-),score=15.94 c18355_g1_i1:28-363(-)
MTAKSVVLIFVVIWKLFPRTTVELELVRGLNHSHDHSCSSCWCGGQLADFLTLTLLWPPPQAGEAACEFGHDCCELLVQVVRGLMGTLSWTPDNLAKERQTVFPLHHHPKT